MSAVDDYKIALNILAKFGINHPDFIKEYAKAKNLLHQFDSMNQIQAHNKTQIKPVQAPISGQPDQSTAQEPLGQNTGVNQPNTPSVPQGQGTLFLPQK
jgi:hypothetical protein